VRVADCDVGDVHVFSFWLVLGAEAPAGYDFFRAAARRSS
jgi:hypothetical protein